MGVMANVKGKLGEVWYRLKAWAHSVPPDVWIGLAIAAATLIVVWLAYKKAGGSSSSSGTDSGTSIPNLPVTSGSSSLGTIPVLDWGPAKLPILGPIQGNPRPDPNVTVTGAPDPWSARKAQQGWDINQYWADYNTKLQQGAIVHSADIHAASQANAAKAAATAKANAVTQHQGAIVHSADIHAASQALTHALAKPPTGKRQDVVF